MTLLLHPRQANVRHLVRETARAFHAGPRIHPSRAAYEFYPTPPEATRALLAAEPFPGSIWEPACGTGWIAKELEAAGHAVVATDLVDYGYGQANRDFLAERQALATHVVTNPPYGRGLGDAFCRHALALTKSTGGKVAMLLPIHSLCHPIRHPFFTQHPPSIIYALDECHCYPYGDPSQATSSLMKQRYCWIVWDHGFSGPTRFQWLTTAPYRKSVQQSSAQPILLLRKPPRLLVA